MTTKRPIRQQLLDQLIRALIHLVARLPLAVIHRLGSGLAWGMIRLPNRQRRNALANIVACLPELSSAEQIALRDANLREFGKTYLEIGFLWLRPVEELLGLVREVSGAELLRRADGKGLIVLSPHIGAWELAGLYLSSQGPTAIFYKPQKYLDDLILTARRRGGARLAPTTAKGVRVLVQALERGEYVGILPDQEPKPDRGSVFAPFFGVPALTMLLVSKLARRTGSPVIFLFAERLPRSAGFRIHCLAAPDGVDSADDEVAAAALNLGVERCVRTCPEQFAWPYKRFRRRPQGAPKLYSGKLGDSAVLARLATLELRPRKA
jgi:KDO2-lipid IV(A) lauroyltransferase